MANEVTLNASLAYNDASAPAQLIQLVNKQWTPGTLKFAWEKQLVTTSEAALNLGNLASAALGTILILNLDPTNFVEVRVGTGGTKIVRVSPGRCALFEFGQGVTAPFIIADTASCWIAYGLVNP